MQNCTAFPKPSSRFPKRMGSGYCISVILLRKLGRTVLAQSLVGWCRTNVGKMNVERRFFELSEGKSEDGGDGDDKNERNTCCSLHFTAYLTSLRPRIPISATCSTGRSIIDETGGRNTVGSNMAVDGEEVTGCMSRRPFLCDGHDAHFDDCISNPNHAA